MKKNRNLRLQALIDEIKIEKQELAHLIKSDPSTITRWLKGKPQPNRTSCQRIALATGCNLSWIRDGIGEMFPDKNKDYSNVQTGNGSHFSQQDSTYQANTTGPPGMTEDALELVTLIQQCESPLRIKKMIEEYKKELADFSQE